MAITDNNQQDIIDIQLDNPRKKFRINGDNSKIIELNPTDMNIVSRLKESYKKLNELAEQASSLLVNKEEATVEEELESVSNALSQLDREMRDLVDQLFDAKVSDVVASDMNMYSLSNGKFWFEHVIEVLSGLYQNNFKEEFKKMQARMSKHTSKYTKKGK